MRDRHRGDVGGRVGEGGRRGSPKPRSKGCYLPESVFMQSSIHPSILSSSTHLSIHAFIYAFIHHSIHACMHHLPGLESTGAFEGPKPGRLLESGVGVVVVGRNLLST